MDNNLVPKFDLTGGWLDLVLIFLGPVLLSFPLEFLFSLTLASYIGSDYYIMFNSLIRTLLMLVFFYFIAIRKNSLQWDDLGLRRENLLRNVLRGVLAGLIIVLLIIVLNSLLISIITSYTGLQPEAQTVTQLVLELDGGIPLAIMIIIVVFLAPLFEELFFRGLVYPFLADRWDDRKAILGSSLLFGLAHGNPWSILPAMLGGIALVLLFRRYKNLWTAVFAHSTWNGMMIIILLIIKALGL